MTDPCVEAVEAANTAWTDYEPPSTAGAQTHRQTMLSKHAFVSGYLAMHSSRPVEPASWWMIERDDLEPRPQYFAWSYEPGELPRTWPKGFHHWTPDWSKGARFSTREAAEAQTNGSDGLRVCEHGFMHSSRPVVEDGLADLRQREVQMIGAAISLRSWQKVETAYSQLRDKMDARLNDPARLTPEKGK